MTQSERAEMIAKVCMAFEKWWQEHPELSFMDAAKKWFNRRVR
jgi:hypothetical protein